MTQRLTECERVTVSWHLVLKLCKLKVMSDWRGRVCAFGAYPSLAERGAVLFRGAPRPRAATLVYCCRDTQWKVGRNGISPNKLDTRRSEQSKGRTLNHFNVHYYKHERFWPWSWTKHFMTISGHNGHFIRKPNNSHWSKHILCYVKPFPKIHVGYMPFFYAHWITGRLPLAF